MLDLKFVRENLDALRERLALRGMEVDLAPFQALESERRSLILEIEELRARRNAVSKEIAAKKKRGEDAAADVAAMREVGDRVQELEGRQRANDEALVELMRNVPNLPHASVPVGRSEEDNVEIRRWGDAAGVRLRAEGALGPRRGARHPRLRARREDLRRALLRLVGAGARLERALINFMLDLHAAEHGYREVLPPFLVNRDEPRRHRPAAEVRGRAVPLRALGVLPDPDRRGPGDEPPPRRDPRGRRACR